MNLRNGTVTGVSWTLPPQHRPVFEAGVALVFKRWTALELAVENEWGGANSRDKADQFYHNVLEWFYKKRGEQAEALAAVQRVGSVAAAANPCCWWEQSTTPTTWRRTLTTS